VQTTSNQKLLRKFGSVPSITWILLGLVILFSLIAPHFASIDNIYNLIRQGAVLVIVSSGMLVAIASAGIDLGVGSVIGLTGIIVGYTFHRGLSWPVAVLVAVFACSLTGLISGLIIAKGKIFPFVVTFGMLFMAKSASLGLAQGGSIHIENATYTMINGGSFLFLPIPFWITSVLVLFVLFLMKRTVFGRYIFSIGSDPVAAEWMGIKVDLYRVLVYVLSGTLAGIAGVVLSSRLSTGSALIGQGTEFMAIAAVVIGGTPITGGRGSLVGTILGALVITVLQNGLNMLGLSSELVSAIVGVTLMVGVIFAQAVYRGGSRGNR
jgi:ribose/xylose/arabinose/galactoside ABC-type transport system permease subunit